MPDVIVIGGGMIGATTAWQLAERGAEVLLLERGHLASGATRRSQGLLLEPEVDPMQPLFAESNRLYDHLAESAGLDLALDREPIGTLFLATSEAQLERLGANVPADGTMLDRDGGARGRAGPGSDRVGRAADARRPPHRSGRADGGCRRDGPPRRAPRSAATSTSSASRPARSSPTAGSSAPARS